MSPLALLSEGEVGWIVDPADNEKKSAPYDADSRHGPVAGSAFRPRACCDRSDCTKTLSRSEAHLQSMGLRPGKQVQMITNSGRGPIVLRVDECRIAMGRGAAMKIYIRRNEE